MLQLLKVALLADTTKNTYSVNYFFEEHGHGENDNESKENQEDESLQGNQGNQNVFTILGKYNVVLFKYCSLFFYLSMMNFWF